MNAGSSVLLCRVDQPQLLGPHPQRRVAGEDVVGAAGGAHVVPEDVPEDGPEVGFLQQVASVGGSIQAAKQIHQRRFSRSRLTHDSDEFSRADRQGYSSKGMNFDAAIRDKRAAYVLHRNQWFTGSFGVRRILGFVKGGH